MGYLCNFGRGGIDGQRTTCYNCLMTAYGNHQTTGQPTSPLYFNVAANKVARRKILEEVEQRRRQNYLRYFTKMRLQQKRDLDTITTI
ncbi:MAG TPA: hypothetical protein VEP90_17065 [Methylomirabilota bacterium]|nr:hypothetical protein [Methylomirabilota bacterium]